MGEIEPEGCIKIDNVDIRSVGLTFLRQGLAIIPQTPFIFQSSIRSNLDPFDQYTTEEIWQALQSVQLKDFVVSLEKQLDTEITSVSNTFSIGQKQLICLARMLLRQSRLVVLDEATANVDLHTDSIIQEMVKTRFEESTVFCIAHRLLTIADYDKVLVLD